jgi:hypothetical protein
MELLMRIGELGARATREALRRIATQCRQSTSSRGGSCTRGALACIETTCRASSPRGSPREPEDGSIRFFAARACAGWTAKPGSDGGARARLFDHDECEREVLRAADAVKEGERVKTTLARGWIDSEVRRKG